VKLTTVLFDLDATLLPMNQEQFLKYYFGLLTKKMAPLGYDPGELINVLWKGTAAMRANEGPRTNEEVFWEVFDRVYGEKGRKDRPLFDEFYANEFNGAQVVCGRDPEALATVSWLKSEGFRLALATSPVFPPVAARNRLGWAGIDPAYFERITSYDNTCSSKPNPRYYTELAENLGVDPAECLMVGNDVAEDMPAEQTGMRVFLLTDHLINTEGVDISRYPQGGFRELRQQIEVWREQPV